MRNLREEHGYTYGAGSNFSQRGSQYELMAYAAVEGDVTGAALSEFKSEFDRLATGDITPDELHKALSTVRYDLTNTAESTSSLAGALISLASDGRPLDSVSTAYRILDEVDLDRANALARSGIYDWSSLVVVLVGDAESVAAQLTEYGFGAPDVVDSMGRAVAR
jgi:predicted Zn-dependent peptidase